VLIGTQRRAKLLGTKMRLLAPCIPVTQVLRSTGLDRSFTIHTVIPNEWWFLPGPVHFPSTQLVGIGPCAAAVTCR